MVIPENGHDPKMMNKLRLRVRWAIILVITGLILVHHQWIFMLLKNYFDTH